MTAANKADYEAIPDVEAADTAGGDGQQEVQSAKEKYPGFSDSQVDLLSTMDDAIANSSQLVNNFQLPAVNPADLASQGQGFVRGLLAPTLTAIGTTLVALVLSVTAQASSTAEATASSWLSTVSLFLVSVFPYGNVVAVFASSLPPMRQRMMIAVEPIFVQLQKVQDLAVERVRAMAVTVDETLDQLQTKIHETIQPVQSTLDMATQQEAMLKTIRPDIDIPDPTDIDREFDEAQGVVGRKIAEAETYIYIQSRLPQPLQSADSFYRWVILPVACTALLMQLGVTFATTSNHPPPQLPHPTTTTNTTGNVISVSIWNVTKKTGSELGFRTNGSRMVDHNGSMTPSFGVATPTALRRGAPWLDPNATTTTTTDRNHPTAAIVGALDQASTHPDDGVWNHSSNTLIHGKELLNDWNDSGYENEIQKSVSGEVEDGVSTAKAQGKEFPYIKTSDISTFDDPTAPFHDALTRGNATTTAAAATTPQHVLQDNARERAQEYKEELGTTYQTTVGNAKSMLKSVAISYAIALLQLGLVYVMTNEAIKAWVVNKILERASNEVARTLREQGVSRALDDVFGTRMGRVRQKVLKLFTLVQELEGLLGNNGNNPVAALASGANVLADRFGFGKKK